MEKNIFSVLIIRLPKCGENESPLRSCVRAARPRLFLEYEFVRVRGLPLFFSATALNLTILFYILTQDQFLSLPPLAPVSLHC